MAEDARVDLGDGLELRLVELGDLHEQDVNAQVMEPDKFDRLVKNIQERGALESLPYCALQDGRLEIVSGHHRARAARAAGLDRVWVMVDTELTTRSLLTAKQIAHNALVGRSDEEILRRMIDTLSSPDDVLMTGLDVDLLPIPEEMDLPALSTPRADFEWRTVIFTFLPHQMDDFQALIEQMESAEVVGVAPLDSYDDFVRALMRYSRFKNIRHVGSVIHALTQAAIRETAGAD